MPSPPTDQVFSNLQSAQAFEDYAFESLGKASDVNAKMPVNTSAYYTHFCEAKVPLRGQCYQVWEIVDQRPYKWVKILVSVVIDGEWGGTKKSVLTNPSFTYTCEYTLAKTPKGTSVCRHCYNYQSGVKSVYIEGWVAQENKLMAQAWSVGNGGGEDLEGVRLSGEEDAGVFGMLSDPFSFMGGLVGGTDGDYDEFDEPELAGDVEEKSDGVLAAAPKKNKGSRGSLFRHFTKSQTMKKQEEIASEFWTDFSPHTRERRPATGINGGWGEGVLDGGWRNR